MANHGENKKPLPIPLLVIAAVVALVALVVFGRFCSSAATIDITVNGTPLTLHGAKTMETAIRESGLPINPGDLISLKGTVLKKSAGSPFAATINGSEETTDPNYQLRPGDSIELRDGDDIVEDYDVTLEIFPHEAVFGGVGAITKLEPGTDGVTEIRTGKISGDITRRQTHDATDTVCRSYNPDVGDDKVVALTFDEGPSEKYTSEILDILKESDARATFFCVGVKVDNSPDLVKRERNDGHQVCTNSYDLSWDAPEGPATINDDGTMTPLDTTGLADEIERGRQAISNALDGEEVGRIVRVPAEMLTEKTAAALDDKIDADIGWTVDTGDWIEYNSAEVYDVLMRIEAGDIVLLHDGGGDCSGTIQALRRALPQLKEKGFSFVTIDDMMGYPEK